MVRCLNPSRSKTFLSVEIPTWQHISFLYSVLCLPSQQNSFSLVSNPCTKSDRNYFSTIHHSNASLSPSINLRSPIPNQPRSQSTLTMLAKRPFPVPQQAGLIQQAMPTNSANQPMADQAGQQEIRIKGGPQGDSQHSHFTSQAEHVKRGTQLWHIKTE
jgi:hypothetical protein